MALPASVSSSRCRYSRTNFVSANHLFAAIGTVETVSNHDTFGIEKKVRFTIIVRNRFSGCRIPHQFHIRRTFNVGEVFPTVRKRYRLTGPPPRIDQFRFRMAMPLLQSAFVSSSRRTRRREKTRQRPKPNPYFCSHA